MLDTLAISVLLFLIGVSISVSLSYFRKRLSAYNELCRIRSSLTRLVLENQRINSLYPPKYVTGDLRKLCQDFPTRGDKCVDWMSLTDDYLSVVKSRLADRIEWAAGRNPKLADALKYTMEKSGKMVRCRLIFLLGNLLSPGNKNVSLTDLAQVIELEHAASLLHDDVVDDSDVRRGIASHRKKFGDRNAVLTGDNLISVLVEILTTDLDINITRLVANSIESLVIGELLQLVSGVSTDANSSTTTLIEDEILPREFQSGTNDKNAARIKMYLKKSYFKTASLFSCLGQCVAVITNQKQSDNLGLFCFYFGVAFQLVDDMLDLTFLESSDNAAGKPVGGSDIRNGTVTLPILFACIDDENLTENERIELVEMVDRKFASATDFRKTIELVSKSNGMEKSRKLIATYFGYCRYLLRARIAPHQTTQYADAIEQLLLEFESRRK